MTDDPKDNLPVMTDDPKDNLPDELHSDGELSEDSLYEWVDGEWVSVEHDPFYGFDEPQEWIEPPRQIYPPPRRTRNIEPEEIDIPPEQTTWFSIKVAGGIFLAIIVLAVFLSGLQDGNSGEVMILPTATPSPPVLAFATERPTTISSATPSHMPSPMRVPTYTYCAGSMPSSATIFVSSNRIFARSTVDIRDICLLSSIGQDVRDPQLSSDGTHLYYLSSEGVRLVNVETGESRILDNYQGESIQHFDLSPDNTRIVYEQDGTLYIYDLASGNITDFSHITDLPPMTYPVWSPDGSYIYFSSGTQILRIAADGSDFEVLYQDAAQSVTFFDLAVSDDGTQIAILYRPSTETSGKGMLVLNMDSGVAEELIPFETDEFSHPLWSAEGTHIAVMKLRDGADAPVIAIYRLSGTMSNAVTSAEPAMNEMNGFDLWFGAD